MARSDLPGFFLSRNSGFTLLEIVISLGIIITLSSGLATMLRSNLDIRESLAQRAEVMHRVNFAMEQLTNDLEHTFALDDSTPGGQYGDSTRKINTIFHIELHGNGDELWLTTMNHKSLRANSYESDTTYVVYRLKDDKGSAGRTSLYRGEAKRIPENLNDEPELHLLAKGVKNFKLRAWRGDQWSKDRWDTTKREWRNKIPHLVYVEIEAWEIDPTPGNESSFSADQTPTFKTNSVVYLPTALPFEELKTDKALTMRWDKLGEAIQ